MFQLKRKAVNCIIGLLLALSMAAGSLEAVQAAALPGDGIEQHILGASVKKSKGLEYQSWKLDSRIICVVKNTRSYALNLNATCTYYNKSKKKMADRSTGNYCLEPGKQCVFTFITPRNSKGNYISYKSHKITFKQKRISKNIVYGTKYIKTVKKTKSDTGITVKFKNNSKTKWQFVHATCVFYDSKGKAVGETNMYLHCEKPKSTVTATFRYPYDSNFKTIKTKSYKIFIDYAYKYGSSR